MRWLFVVELVFLCCFAGKLSAKVIELEDANWSKMLENEWMVEFFAPWCPACKSLESTWTQFAGWSDDLGIKTAKIDVTKSPGLSGRFLVTALPTIYHVINGEFRQYRGSRDMNSLMSFIEDKKWSSVEKVSDWKRPDTIQMSIVSLFFKLSHFLKELNNTLLKDYGLPTWGSYAIFAVATILIGALLGLMLVCVIDFLFPQKATQRQSFSEKKEKDSDDEIRGDDLEDDEEEQHSTSEGEKYSGSDSEDQEEEPIVEEKKKEEIKASPKKSPKAEVRKRKARKD